MKKLSGFALALMITAMAMGFAGCGGTASPDEDAEWVAENAGADTANVQPAPSAESANVQQVDATVQEAAPQAMPPAEQPAAAPEIKAQDSAPPAEAPPSAATTGEVENYAVKKGDTLMKVAFTVYGDIGRWRDIYTMNQDVLKSANTIYPGMKLKYEKPTTPPLAEHNGDSYLIKQGDTLGSIATDLYAKRSKWKKIYENNKTLIQDPNRIYAGFYLYYQMTEEERQWAESVKAKRQQQLPNQQQLGAAPAAPAAAGALNVAPPAPSQEASAAPAGGGLSNLAAPAAAPDSAAPAPQQDRMPTATQ